MATNTARDEANLTTRGEAVMDVHEMAEFAEMAADEYNENNDLLDDADRAGYIATFIAAYVVAVATGVTEMVYADHSFDNQRW
jgi:hypothetical protein